LRIPEYLKIVLLASTIFLANSSASDPTSKHPSRLSNTRAPAFSRLQRPISVVKSFTSLLRVYLQMFLLFIIYTIIYFSLYNVFICSLSYFTKLNKNIPRKHTIFVGKGKHILNELFRLFKPDLGQAVSKILSNLVDCRKVVLNLL